LKAFGDKITTFGKKNSYKHFSLKQQIGSQFLNQKHIGHNYYNLKVNFANRLQNDTLIVFFSLKEQFNACFVYFLSYLCTRKPT